MSCRRWGWALSRCMKRWISPRRRDGRWPGCWPCLPSLSARFCASASKQGLRKHGNAANGTDGHRRSCIVQRRRANSPPQASASQPLPDGWGSAEPRSGGSSAELWSRESDQPSAINVRLQSAERNPYRTFSGDCSWEGAHQHLGDVGFFSQKRYPDDVQRRRSPRRTDSCVVPVEGAGGERRGHQVGGGSGSVAA